MQKVRGFFSVSFVFDFSKCSTIRKAREDLQTKIEELQIIIQSLRENDKVKEEDALTHLSDQLLVLSERIYITVRKKTNNII